MIAANFTKSQKSITVESVTQGDYGQKLSIHGLSLPSSVEVHFVAAGEQEGIKMFGTTQAEETVVEIPNLLIAKGKDLTAYIFVCDSMEGKTVRTIRIPVHRKPEVEEIELPPDEQDIVRELMGLVNGFESEIDKLDEKKADKTMVGNPLVADSIQDMRDVEKIYVYVGSGTGELIPGNWYYWDGNYWVSGGVYNAAALGEGSVTTGKLADQSVTYEKLAAEVVELEFASEIVSMHYASNCDPVNRGFEVVDVAYVPEMQTARVEFTNLEHGETEPFKYALGIKMEYISGESTLKEDMKNIQVSGEGFSEPYVLFEDIPDGYDHMKLYIIIDYSHSVSPSGVQLSRIEFDIKATKKERQKAIFPIMELRPGNVPPGIITTANLKEESVTEEKIGRSSVSGRCIVDRAITEAKLGDLAVSERCIADGAVTEAKLGDLAVSERCIADKGITYEKLSDEIAMVEFEGRNEIAKGTKAIFIDGNNNFTVTMDLPDNAIFVSFKLSGIYDAGVQTIPVILTCLNNEDIKYTKNAEFLINGMETNSIGQEYDTSCNKLKISGTVNGFLFSPTDSYLTYTFYNIKEIISAKFPSLKLASNNIPDGIISPQKLDNTKPHEHFLMKSSNGTVYKIRVTDAGELSIEADR